MSGRLVNLHYENLPDLDYGTLSLMRRVNFSVGDYQRYLETAMKMMWAPERLEKVRWRQAPRNLLAASGRATQGDRTIQASQVWVAIEETDAREGTDVVEDFCSSKYVVDVPERWAQKIRVLDYDYNLGLLLLNGRPAGQEGILYLPPDLNVLSRQRRALIQLRDRPEPEHRGILRLLEDSQKVRWPDVSPARKVEWEFLTDDTIEGTDEQRKFVRIALETPDFAVMEGPPGSGKTTSICELIVQNIRRHRRVMLCASTHVAVDNVLESLQERGVTEREVLAVRIGDERRISDDVKEFQLQNRAKKERNDLVKRLSSIKSPTDAQRYLLDALRNSDESQESVISRLILESANLVCGTTIGILQHPDIRAREARKKAVPQASANGVRQGDGEVVIRPFDCLILDEASKTTFQEFLVPAMFSRRWVLVGDDRQLSPYVETTYVQDNVKTMLPPNSDARVCLDVFRAWEGVERRAVQGVLVVDPTDRESYLRQAEALGVPCLDLVESEREPHALDLVGAHVILARKRDMKVLEPLIAPDFAVSPAEHATQELNRRHDWWLEHHPWGSEGCPTEQALSEWADSLSWRLGRSFELRHVQEELERLEAQVDALTPHWQSELELSNFKDNLDKLKRIALPSVLELIQRGFGRREGSRSGSSLTDGMDPNALSERHVLLSYQHRMHPDISKAPRELVYDSVSLKDPRSMATKRAWSYARYPSRSGWIQTVGGRPDARNANSVEARIVIEELDAFLDWAAGHHNQDASGGRPWVIAILAFYKGQESLLRKHLQKRFDSSYRSQFTSPDGTAKIRLGTVDRFQGHEADLVILSFVRGGSIGFLDSPNRLNVAITRARYQIVMIGNQRDFANQRRDTLLKKLAGMTPTLRIALEPAPAHEPETKARRPGQ